MRTEAILDILKKMVRQGVECEKCPFPCKDGGMCMLITITKRMEILRRNLVRAQRLLREAVDDLRDADSLECTHCKHYRKLPDDDCEADCIECEQECLCKYCTDNERWEWRGYAEGKE